MKLFKKLTDAFRAHTDDSLPVVAITGPILGLFYIILLPFMGLALFIFLISCRLRQNLVPA